MLDPKFIRENSDIVRQSLKNRSDNPKLVDDLLELDTQRKKIVQEVETLKSEKNEASKKIGELIKEKKDVSVAKEKVSKLSLLISEQDEILKQVENKYYSLLDMIPNIPHETVPIGKTEADNVKVKEWGKIREYKFKPKDHVELGNINGLFDFERGDKSLLSAFVDFGDNECFI